jgi:hypothetical protein
MELADDDGDAAKRTKLDDSVVCREGTPHTAQRKAGVNRRDPNTAGCA